MSLNITVIQSELHWEDVDKNLEMFALKIAAITQPVDVIVLPEMFNTGFSMESEKLAETMSGKTVAWMKILAKKNEAVLTGSLIIYENGNYFNRLVWVQPDSSIYTYDKRHLFRMADEDSCFSAGTERLIVKYKGWRICPMICYDLRFPVWARNKKLAVDRCCGFEALTNTSDPQHNVYDVLIYVANWPAVRKQPWSKLLEARSIENQCYVVGVNRVGKDDNNIDYSGNSVVVDSKGEVISTILEHEDCSETLSLSLTELNSFRAKFPVGLDGDDFTL